ncbi:MAG: hypothetical protein HY264_01495 [Chloroflexi bacterium]|nr:hypothetical protein [Chloroflexota bacterium]
MPNEPLPTERVHGSVSADGLRLGAALWIIAGVICAGLLIVVFLGENLLAQNPGLSARVLGGAVAGLLTGRMLLARPSVGVLRWSNVLGIAWALAFGSLALTALNGPDRGPMVSSSLITGFGVAGALVTFWAGRSGRRRE